MLPLERPRRFASGIGLDPHNSRLSRWRFQSPTFTVGILEWVIVENGPIRELRILKSQPLSSRNTDNGGGDEPRMSRIDIIEQREHDLGEKPEGRLLVQLIQLTGREADETPPAGSQEEDRALKFLEIILKSISRELGGKTEPLDETVQETVLYLLNQALGALGRETLSRDFANVIFFGEPFSHDAKGNPIPIDPTTFIKTRVDMFRQVSLYHYGNFKRAFRTFHQAGNDRRPAAVQGRAKELREKWDELFKERPIRKRPEKLGFESVETDMLWSLGYLAGQYAKIIDEGRRELLPYLNRARESSIRSYDQLAQRFSEWRKKDSLAESFEAIVYRAALPPDASIYPEYESENNPFERRLDSAIRICSKTTAQRLDTTRNNGRMNTFVYLTARRIDVYFATSMRTPEHFYNASLLVNALFESGTLREHKLLVFDPTISFSHERLDKGLIECLMIARSEVTVYNAQDDDTFGKDSEAAVSLALGHPVVVYVARLFRPRRSFEKGVGGDQQVVDTDPSDAALDPVYGFVDQIIDAKISEGPDDRELNRLCKDMAHNLAWVPARLEDFRRNPINKDRLVKTYLDESLPAILRSMGESRLRRELLDHGYSLSDTSERGDNTITYLDRRVAQFETRLGKDSLQAKALREILEIVKSKVADGEKAYQEESPERRAIHEALGVVLPDDARNERARLLDLDGMVRRLTDVIIRLERRALIFLEGHPLSIQTAPSDGVARGVLVSRDVAGTQKLVVGLLSHTLKYRIEREQYGWKLIEIDTGSPVRVLPVDGTLVSAYWQTFYEPKGELL